MTGKAEWQIPASTLHWLKHAPTDQPIALLLRHSVREALMPDGDGYHVPLTATGVQLAIELGQWLGSRLKSLHSSPLLRCMQTADALKAGSGVALDIISDQQLGDPGIFVADAQQAGQHWQTLGHERMMQFLINSDETVMSGMANPAVAADALVQHMLNVAADEQGIHVFVTHDSLVAATALRWLKQKIIQYEYPAYLEGAFFWRSKKAIHAVYREQSTIGDATRLSKFNRLNKNKFPDFWM